jgi:hypothetical protein
VQLPILDASHGWIRDRHFNPKGSAAISAIIFRELTAVWPDLQPPS